MQLIGTIILGSYCSQKNSLSLYTCHQDIHTNFSAGIDNMLKMSTWTSKVACELLNVFLCKLKDIWYHKYVFMLISNFIIDKRAQSQLELIMLIYTWLQRFSCKNQLCESSIPCSDVWRTDSIQDQAKTSLGSLSRFHRLLRMKKKKEYERIQTVNIGNVSKRLV